LIELLSQNSVVAIKQHSTSCRFVVKLLKLKWKKLFVDLVISFRSPSDTFLSKVDGLFLLQGSDCRMSVRNRSRILEVELNSSESSVNGNGFWVERDNLDCEAKAKPINALAAFSVIFFSFKQKNCSGKGFESIKWLKLENKLI
jgi:hypothetical protein